MPFDPKFKYGASKEGVTHASVPPATRCCGPREFGIIYVKGQHVGLALRRDDNLIQRGEVFHEHLPKTDPNEAWIIAFINLPFDLMWYHLDNTITTYKNCWITQFALSYDAGSKTVFEDATFTFESKETSIIEPPNVL